MALQGLHYVSSVGLRRINGIGTTLVGRFNAPDSPDWYYKQFAFTIFLVPVYLGRFYAVQRSKKVRGWKVAGWLSGAEMAERYGTGAYWWFKVRVLFLPLVCLAAFAFVMNHAWKADEQALHHPPAAAAAPAAGPAGQ